MAKSSDIVFEQICTSVKRRNVSYIVGDEETREMVIVDAGIRQGQADREVSAM